MTASAQRLLRPSPGPVHHEKPRPDPSRRRATCTIAGEGIQEPPLLYHQGGECSIIRGYHPCTSVNFWEKTNQYKDQPSTNILRLCIKPGIPLSNIRNIIPKFLKTKIYLDN
ncbi:hypothetical protein AVEN_137761-1 [Araneus ventricosus]|uniref:Uncharacterized protein n=1 Tax=Araneus ventricosus TaxID=182803 RepID=A0A4Y2RPD5_ARAVE|nr:hypothetical protein AVEN_137761-1 [Araneus ventricosus]